MPTTKYGDDNVFRGSPVVAHIHTIPAAAKQVEDSRSQTQAHLPQRFAQVDLLFHVSPQSK